MNIIQTIGIIIYFLLIMFSINGEINNNGQIILMAIGSLFLGLGAKK